MTQLSRAVIAATNPRLLYRPIHKYAFCNVRYSAMPGVSWV